MARFGLIQSQALFASALDFLQGRVHGNDARDRCFRGPQILEAEGEPRCFEPAHFTPAMCPTSGNAQGGYSPVNIGSGGGLDARQR